MRHGFYLTKGLRLTVQLTLKTLQHAFFLVSELTAKSQDPHCGLPHCGGTNLSGPGVTEQTHDPRVSIRFRISPIGTMKPIHYNWSSTAASATGTVEIHDLLKANGKGFTEAGLTEP